MLARTKNDGISLAKNPAATSLKFHLQEHDALSKLQWTHFP
jgi:hypothetical protein